MVLILSASALLGSDSPCFCIAWLRFALFMPCMVLILSVLPFTVLPVSALHGSDSPAPLDMAYQHTYKGIFPGAIQKEKRI